MITIDLVRLVLQWANDAQSMEMIQSRNYTYDYFGDYEMITEDELELLVTHINPILRACDCSIRVSWNMGEIVPVRSQSMIKFIDGQEMK
jgi:hypothetical protein